MSTIGTLSRHLHFSEFDSPLPTAEGVLSPDDRKALALGNLTSLSTSSDLVGTKGAATISAEEFFDGVWHTTRLTCTDFNMGTMGDNASLADGALVYTLPDGEIIIGEAMFQGTLLATASVLTDTPDVGIGTTVASGAVSVLGGTAAFENVIGGSAAASINNGAVGGVGGVVANGSTLPLRIASSGGLNHTLYLNFADGWADVTTATDVLFTGVIVLRWMKVRA